jgi:hypothetical protein
LTFELWDTSAERIVGAFENERAALDAAYRKLLEAGRAGGTLTVRCAHLVKGEEARPAGRPLGASLLAMATLTMTLLRWAIGR